jgi:hypothetical protein
VLTAGLQGFDKHGGEAAQVVYYRYDRKKQPKNEKNMPYHVVEPLKEKERKMPSRLGIFHSTNTAQPLVANPPSGLDLS